MDAAYLKFVDLLVRSVLDAKLRYVEQHRPIISSDTMVAHQIASGLVIIAHRRAPTTRRGEIMWEG